MKNEINKQSISSREEEAREGREGGLDDNNIYGHLIILGDGYSIFFSESLFLKFLTGARFCMDQVIKKICKKTH